MCLVATLVEFLRRGWLIRLVSNPSPRGREFPVSRFYRGARYGTLGGGTTETLRDLIGKRVLAGVDPIDGILGLGMF